MNELDIVELIYSAALNGDWQAIVDALRAIGGDLVSTHLYGHDKTSNAVSIAATSGYDPDMLASYDAYYHSVSSWVPGIAAAPVGLVLPAREYCPTEELIATEFYNDWVKPQEDKSIGGGLVLFKDADRFLFLGGNIRQKDQERAEHKWLALLARLGPHLRNAFELQRQLQGERLLNRGYLDVIDRLEENILLIDMKGRIAFQNRAAAAFAASVRFCRMDSAGAMRLVDVQADALFRQGLARLSRGEYQLPEFLFSVPHPGRPILLEAVLAPFNASQSTAVLADFASDRTPAAIFTIRKWRDRRTPAAILADAFSLTAGEAELALAIHAGISLQAHAESRSVSLHTVRNQLKTVFAKTGAHRQAELVAILAQHLDIRR